MTRIVALAALALAAPASARPGEVVTVEHHDPSALPTLGPADAPVTFELFFTPQHGRSQLMRLVEQLQAKHPSQIRIVYRLLSGNGTARIHYMALEANAEGKFADLIDALGRDRAYSLTDAKLLELGSDIGLDPARVDAAIHHPPVVFERVIDDDERRRKERLPGSWSVNALVDGRPLQTDVGRITMADLEREYEDALNRAEDLIDRGADPAHLADAYDAEPVGKVFDVTVQTGATDNELEAVPAQPPLATPPLRLHGLASYGSPDAPVAIVVACNPTSQHCRQPLRAAMLAQESLPDLVRVVWAPYFDMAGDNAADVALLGDGALCAEHVGTGSDIDFDRPASPGWRWLEAVEVDRHVDKPVDKLVDDIADRLHVSRGAFDACRARLAGSTVAWIEAAHRAGVHTTPATLVGGRVYGPITDSGTLQQLVWSELSPGLCDVDHGCLHLGDFTPSWRRGL
ncbi:MAG TPA: hypothetical protein VGF94_05315 [Kofleriaceae bacterium]|jgi:protein-disulfide isomerase